VSSEQPGRGSSECSHQLNPARAPPPAVPAVPAVPVVAAVSFLVRLAPTRRHRAGAPRTRYGTAGPRWWADNRYACQCVYRLRQALGLDGPGTPVKVIAPYSFLGEVQLDLADALGVDVVAVALLPTASALSMRVGNHGRRSMGLLSSSLSFCTDIALTVASLFTQRATRPCRRRRGCPRTGSISRP